MNEPLSSVEKRILDELLQYHAARSQTAERELAAPRSIRQPVARRRMIENAVVWVAILAVGVVFVVRVAGDGGSARAATPAPLHYTAPSPEAPSGSGLLRQLATTAAAQPRDPVPRQDRYAYVKASGWYLVSGDGGPGVGQISPQTTQSWTAPNGRNHTIHVTGSPPEVDDFRAKDQPLATLSTNPVVLAHQLAVGHPRSDGPIEQAVAFTDTAIQQPIRPAVEAAILRLLAKIPHLVNRGTVVDRAGRHGIAVSLDSAYTGVRTRYTLIFDPHTARLLGYEQTLIGPPHKLRVRRGAVLAYTTILAARYLPTIDPSR
jgi:hypothetical protein